MSSEALATNERNKCEKQSENLNSHQSIGSPLHYVENSQRYLSSAGADFYWFPFPDIR